MATRSTIAIATGAATCAAIYCHWDGYPDAPGVGSKLLAHYNDPESIKGLMALGDLSSLGETLDGCEPYNRTDKQTPAAKATLKEQQDRAQGMNCEYFYLWADGGWTVSELAYLGSSVVGSVAAWTDTSPCEWKPRKLLADVLRKQPEEA